MSNFSRQLRRATVTLSVSSVTFPSHYLRAHLRRLGDFLGGQYQKTANDPDLLEKVVRSSSLKEMQSRQNKYNPDTIWWVGYVIHRIAKPLTALSNERASLVHGWWMVQNLPARCMVSPFTHHPHLPRETVGCDVKQYRKYPNSRGISHIVAAGSSDTSDLYFQVQVLNIFSVLAQFVFILSFFSRNCMVVYLL